MRRRTTKGTALECDKPSNGAAMATCVVCDRVIGTDLRRRYCGKVCRKRVGRGTWQDRQYDEFLLDSCQCPTATHEAGHAVVGRALGWRILLVELDELDYEVGLTRFFEHGGSLDEYDPLDAVTVALAGLIAEQILDRVISP